MKNLRIVLSLTVILLFFTSCSLLMAMLGSSGDGGYSNGGQSTTSSSSSYNESKSSTEAYWKMDWEIIASRRDNTNLTCSDIAQIFAVELGKLQYAHVLIYYDVFDDPNQQNYAWQCQHGRAIGHNAIGRSAQGTRIAFVNAAITFESCTNPFDVTTPTGKEIQSIDLTQYGGWQIVCTMAANAIDNCIYESGLICKKYGVSYTWEELEGLDTLKALANTFRKEANRY